MSENSRANHEQSSHQQLPNAGLLRRVAALIYDGLLIVALWMVVGFIALGVNGGDIVEGLLPRGLLYLACIATAFAFYWKFWRDGGQTAGMRAWRLQLKTLNQHPPTHSQCLRRFGVAFFTLGLGTLWMLVDRDGLTLQDRASLTKVVLTPKLKKPSRPQ